MEMERLYELAFLYKKSKLWKRLKEEQIFAVQVGMQKTGYVSVMGSNGEYNGVNLFLEESFQAYRRLCEYTPFSYENEFEEHEMLMGQDCIQLSWGGKDDLYPGELETIREYGKKYGYRFAGKDAYPTFRRFRPSCIPWKVTDEDEIGYMAAALEAALALAENPEIEIKVFRKNNKTVNGMVNVEGKWVPGKRVKVPAPVEEQYPSPNPDSVNRIALHKLQKVKKKDVLECGVVMLPTPIQEDPEAAPHFPYVLMAVMQKKGELLNFFPYTRKQLYEEPQVFLNTLIEALLESKVRPQALHCQDERTYQLLEPLGELLNAPAVKCDYLDVLEECQDEFLDYMDEMNSEDDEEDTSAEDSLLSNREEDVLIEMVFAILGMSDIEAKKLPAEVKNGIKQMIALGAIPQELVPTLKKKLGLK